MIQTGSPSHREVTLSKITYKTNLLWGNIKRHSSKVNLNINNINNNDDNDNNTNNYDNNDNNKNHTVFGCKYICVFVCVIYVCVSI